MKIAVADDEEILLNYLENTVKTALPQAEVIPFSDTAELLEAAGKTQFDIAFLDIQMPGMTGIELARKLIGCYEAINIIFVTGYDGYQGEAMDLFASGYVRKPVTVELIEEQIRHLRYPVSEEKRAFARTFGNFTLFIDGEPVRFTREKCKMAVAYLVHRRGSMVNKKELSCVIFEDGIYDEKRQSYLSRISLDIQRTFERYNLPDLLIRTPNELGINVKLLSCDLYDMLNGKPKADCQYYGEYMMQYSFGEAMMPILDHLSAKG